MAVLIVPDVHERFDRLEAALNQFGPQADRIIFLGDFFDAFGKVDVARFTRICRFIVENVDGVHCDDGTVIPAEFLLGNHDCHYFFRHPDFLCSGYNPMKNEFVEQLIPDEVRRRFRLWTTAGPFTVSHAGFHLDTLQYHNAESHMELLDRAFRGECPAIFRAGRARGGMQPIGGVTWLDWNYEFEDIPTMPQIVGHTHGESPRIQGASHCIDTGLRHVALVEGDTISVMEVLPMSN